jgi:hypothetical protein
MADQYLHDHNHLAAELFDFLLLRSGRPFTDSQACSSGDDWSQVVWDLLRGALNKAFNRKKSGRSSAPRHAGATLAMLDSCCFARATGPMALSTTSTVVGSDGVAQLFSGTGDLPPDDEYPQDNVPAPDNGVSLILLESREAQGG